MPPAKKASTVVALPPAPFQLGQRVKPTAVLLQRYPLWAKKHDREAVITSIVPSFDKQGTFQGWDCFIGFAREWSEKLQQGPRWLVNAYRDIEAAG